MSEKKSNKRRLQKVRVHLWEAWDPHVGMCTHVVHCMLRGQSLSVRNWAVGPSCSSAMQPDHASMAALYRHETVYLTNVCHTKYGSDLRPLPYLLQQR